LFYETRGNQKKYQVDEKYLLPMPLDHMRQMQKQNSYGFREYWDLYYIYQVLTGVHSL
jgi:hypothetical protein